jgi:hypothetical protein
MNEQKGLITRFGEMIDQYRADRSGAAQEQMPSRRSGWLRWLLPTPGNVLFTLLVVGALLWAASAGALPLRAPAAAGTSTGTIAYQGRLADANGNPLTGTYNMIFRLYDAASGGTPLWTEQWTGSNGVKASDGLFNVMLGSLTPIPTSLVTDHASLFLGITVGTDDEMTPRVQLGSVPFAVQALTVPDGSITPAKLDRQYVNKGGDTMGGSLTVLGGITAGFEGGGQYLTINDVPGAKWKLGTGGYKLTFFNDFANHGIFEPKVIFTEGGEVRAKNVSLASTTLVFLISGGANTEEVYVDISNLGLTIRPIGFAQVVNGAADRVLVHYDWDGSTPTQVKLVFFRPDGGAIPAGPIRVDLVLWPGV